jgi:hypothetical protein
MRLSAGLRWERATSRDAVGSALSSCTTSIAAAAVESAEGADVAVGLTGMTLGAGVVWFNWLGCMDVVNPAAEDR